MSVCFRNRNVWTGPHNKPRVHEDSSVKLTSYHRRATLDTIQRRFPETPGQIITTPDAVTVRLERRAFSPVLRKSDLPFATPVPWWGGRPIRYEIT